jgi:enamine deaminase RidA (YjgF/YER057c/UK114 family)
MGGEDAAGKIPGDFEAETNQALNNIGAVLKAAECHRTMWRAYKCISPMSRHSSRMNAVYKAYFKDPRPTRTTVVVAKLVGQGHIEITATARK